jgi:hypothetical protein
MSLAPNMEESWAKTLKEIAGVEKPLIRFAAACAAGQVSLATEIDNLRNELVAKGLLEGV